MYTSIAFLTKNKVDLKIFAPYNNIVTVFKLVTKSIK